MEIVLEMAMINRNTLNQRPINLHGWLFHHSSSMTDELDGVREIHTSSRQCHGKKNNTNTFFSVCCCLFLHRSINLSKLIHGY